MKNLVWIVMGACVFFCYSTFMIAKVDKQVGSMLDLSDVEAFANDETIELPEVGITCGSPKKRDNVGVEIVIKLVLLHLAFINVGIVQPQQESPVMCV